MKDFNMKAIDKPNIVFVMSDQQRYDTAMNKCIMPNLGELAGESMVFENAYTCNPVCSPARASLMTGLLPHNHGMVDCTHTVPRYRAEYDVSKDTISRLIKRNNYKTAYFGKWHIERSHKLEEYGFDEYITEKEMPGFPASTLKKVEINTPGYNAQTLCAVQNEGCEATEEHFIFDKAIDFIRREKHSPFCVFLSTYAPHDPYLTPKETYDLFKKDDIDLPRSYNDKLEGRPNIYKRMQRVFSGLSETEIREAIACYYGCCALVDRQIGRLTSFLKESGLWNNTIIVYTSDHGDALGAHGLFTKNIFPFEETYHIPLIVKAPGLSAGSNSVRVGTHDIAPTLLELAGLPSLTNPIDGVSVIPWLCGRNKTQRTGYAEYFGARFFWTQRIVWKDNLKYVFNAFDFDELYDLKKDPHEMKNEIDNPEYSSRVVEMARSMWDIAKTTNDTTLIETDYYPFRIAPVGPGREKVNNAYNKVIS